MRPIPGHDPSVAAAERRAASGDPAGAVALWQAAAEAGGPLIGAPDATGTRLPVTFLWRGRADRVVLIGPHDYGDLRRTELTRFPGTDVWHLTLDLPAGGVLSYAFSENDHGDVLDPAAELVSLRGWRPDPLNPRRFRWAANADGAEPDPLGHARSALYLPPARPHPATIARPGVARGQLTMHRMRRRSTGLAHDHRVWVYRPAGDPGTDRHVAVLLDGDCYVAPMLSTPTILDNLIADGSIPPTYAIMVASVDRLAELNGNRTFLRALTDHLMPWAAGRWPISADPARTIVGGSSLGANCAAYAALGAPHRFGAVLSQSGAYQAPAPARFPGGPIRQYAGADGPRLRWHLTVGSWETDPDTRAGADGSLLDANRRLRDVLVAGDHQLRYSEFAGGHDYLCWRDALPDALTALIGAP
ncbi:hypothetical protein Athai_15730 [Actinocatenispora thailandica]|uniref:Enterochelin esterase N-terminal domain-containing protein n=1 Tax=Actinocatenispora thailandica TaxID=227318 RepID=A0A7R7DM50_9ACTN|nr:alpha/beta hydrolase-fold protein [Actinocatenispora thailandica]BCJ34070.1 hypothetical protein Athai_15730 [Actinocatenispora thailandica]